MAATVRTERVGQEIHAAIAEMLAKGMLRDPRVGYITLTGVKVSADLKSARVYYSMLGSEEKRKETQAGLDAARGFVRKEVAQRVKLRSAPEIYFTFDGSLDEGAKIEKLLKDVKTKEGW